MPRKKNGFLTFIFSLLPGAGQMYMGFMRRGLSLMGLFFALIFLSSWLNIGPMLYLIPLVWFYGFFDTNNLRSLTDEEFYSMEDDYILFPELTSRILTHSSHRTILAIIFIIIGITILWNNFISIVDIFLPYYLISHLSNFVHYLIQIGIGFGIILGGIYLIRGKKLELDKMIRPKSSNPSYSEPTVTILEAKDITDKEDFQ